MIRRWARVVSTRAASESASTMPTGMPAIRNPAARAGWPMCVAYGVASASGAISQTGTAQANSRIRRVGWWLSTARMPASESRASEPGVARPGGPVAGAPAQHHGRGQEGHHVDGQGAARREQRQQQPADAVPDDLRRLGHHAQQ